MEKNNKASKYLIIDKKRYYHYVAVVFILPIFNLLTPLKYSIQRGKNPFEHSPFYGRFMTLTLVAVLLFAPLVQSMMTKKKMKDPEKEIP